MDTEDDVTWRSCDECDVPYFLGAVLNPRNHRWAPIALSLVGQSEVGNFRIDWLQEFQLLYDGDRRNLGRQPVVLYGTGVYRPHNPSHFLDDIHVQQDREMHQLTRRPTNPKFPMDDSEEDDTDETLEGEAEYQEEVNPLHTFSFPDPKDAPKE